MARGGVDLFNVPKFIAAPSKKRLVQLMLFNNIKRSYEFQYFDIQKDGNQWVAWYYDTMSMAEKKIAVKETILKSGGIDNGS